MSTDWAKVYEKLYGRPITQPGPLPEAAVMEKVVDAFSDSLLGKGSQIRKQVYMEANKAGLPLNMVPYFLALLNEGSLNWPSMSSDQELGLRLIVDVLKESGAFPAYKMTVLPGLEYDKPMDNALKNLGLWGQTRFLADLFKDYAAIIKHHQGTFLKARPEVPKGSEGVILNIYVRDSVKKRPHNYQFGHLVQKAFRLMFD
jgi:hypothetical protein